MSFKINTNEIARIASNNATRSTARVSQSIERLNTGRIINSSSDDSSGLAISGKMNGKLSKNEKIVQNLQNSISFLQTQQTYISQAAKLISRAGELKHKFHAVEANSTDKKMYDREFEEIQIQLREMQSSKFNGISLFASGNIGTLVSSSTHESTLKISNASDNDGEVELSRIGIFDSLFAERKPENSSFSGVPAFGNGAEVKIPDSPIKMESNAGTIKWNIQSFGQPDRFTIVHGSEVIFDKLYGTPGLQRTFRDGTTLTATEDKNIFSAPEIIRFPASKENLSLDLQFYVNKADQLDPNDPSQVNPSTFFNNSYEIEYDSYQLSLTDGQIHSLGDFEFSEFAGFIDVMSNALAQNGASQQRVLTEINNLNGNTNHLEMAFSRITDTDYAKEATQLAQSQLLATTSASMIAKSNNLTYTALTIMGQNSI